MKLIILIFPLHYRKGLGKILKGTGFDVGNSIGKLAEKTVNPHNFNRKGEDSQTIYVES